jgi:ADP-ribose pyrophosphatase YjhB (NUDIX family)
MNNLNNKETVPLLPTFPLTVFRNNLPISIQDEEEWRQFSKDYKLIHAAGGVVHNEKGEILMIFRLGYWDFPKGKVEEGESFEEAAVREVEEETGLQNIELRKPLPNTYHTYTLRDTDILKVTHWYEMHAPQQTLTPQTEEDIAQAIWVPRAEVATKMEGAYPSLQRLPIL